MNNSNDVRYEQLLDPETSGGSGTRTANVDVSGANWAEIIVQFGTDALSQPDISLLESDTTVATTFATITADRDTEDISAATGKNVIYLVDLRGRKKYLRLSVTVDDASVESAAICRLSGLTDGPSGTSEMVGTSTDVAVEV